MAVLRLDLKVPTNYEASAIKEIVLGICNQLDTLATGQSAARYSSLNVTPSGSVASHAVSDIIYDSNATVGASIVPGLPLSYVRVGWVWNAPGSPGVFQEMRIPTGALSTSVPNNVALASDGAGGFKFRTLTSADVPAVSLMSTALGGDVACNNTSNYFDGPSQSVVPGVGTYYVSGTVTFLDTSGATFIAKLWDGTTVVASSAEDASAGNNRSISLSGVFTNPAGNIRISVRDATNTSGKIVFNASGNSKDSTLTLHRVG